VLVVLLATSFSFYFRRQMSVYGESSEDPDSWPMFMHDPQRTGYTQSAAPDTNEVGVKWLYNTTTTGASYPVVANGRVIVSVSDGTVLALNSTTGEKLWLYGNSAVSDYAWPSSPAIDLGRVYVGAVSEGPEYHSLCCLNESTGELLWQYSASDSIQYSPLASNGRVFLSAGCSVYCLNAVDGSFIWNFTTDPEESKMTHEDFNPDIDSAPAILDNILFVRSSNGRLYAIDASTGVKIWRSSSQHIDETYDIHNIGDAPAIYDGKVFFGSFESLLCLSATDGAVIWNNTMFEQSPPAVSDGKVFIGANVGGGIRKFLCFDAATGSSIWDYTLMIDYGGCSSPAVCDGKVIFGTESRMVCCLDENTGSEIWSYEGIGNILHNPVISDGAVFVGCDWQRNAPTDVYPLHGVVYALADKYETSLSLSLNAETALLGFKVMLTGTLEADGAPIGGAEIFLPYSVTGGETWTDITLVQTAADGGYSAGWIPDATGTYLVKATWEPYPLYKEVESLRMLSVESFDAQNVFSVSSNSTLSVLAFDSATRELRFTVTGETGTNGFVEVTVAKSLVANVADLKVFLDGASLDYTAQSTDDSWILYFTYAHSTHDVAVNLGAAPSPIIWFIAVAVVVAVVCACILFYFKKRKQ
jgi:outer membrane protein assembly factor BamB